MDSITLKYEVEPVDEDAFYPGALTNITAKVFKDGQEIGTIGGVEVDRQRIGENSFHTTFDEHSGDLEWVGGALLENRYGRTKLQSLRDAGDDNEFNFFFMDTFYINKSFSIDSRQSSDVATFALRKFLHGKHVKGELSNGCWINSSVSYVLQEDESNYAGQEVQQGKRKRGDDSNNSNYHEVIPFLRNGFFQDAALIRSDPDNARILVGGIEHFEKSLLLESEARGKVNLLRRGKPEKKLKVADTDIFKLVSDLVNEVEEKRDRAAMMGMSSVMAGLTRYKPPEDCTSQDQLNNLRREILKRRTAGGSLARSGALHLACEKNAVKVARLLLMIDETGAAVKDHLDRTPLIVAAINAAGRLSINGIDDTAVIDALLSVGASKSAVDSSNMTAYGHFRRNSSRYLQITHYEHRHKLTNLEHKLYPPGGPSRGDFSEGSGGSSGLVDYGPEDKEADREMGRYEDENDDCDY